MLSGLAAMLLPLVAPVLWSRTLPLDRGTGNSDILFTASSLPTAVTR
ncbi:MAG: hypothetical protein QOF01_946 [Thermomicrobiales bacterium]|nr:hypothetical protein [Thermomicrobiales bacterium]